MTDDTTFLRRLYRGYNVSPVSNNIGVEIREWLNRRGCVHMDL